MFLYHLLSENIEFMNNIVFVVQFVMNKFFYPIPQIMKEY